MLSFLWMPCVHHEEENIFTLCESDYGKKVLQLYSCTYQEDPESFAEMI